MLEKEIAIEQLEHEEMLQGFKGEGIDVATIGKHLYRNGVLVRLVIGRNRLKYEFDFKALGIDFSKTNSSDFAKGHMEKGKISLLPLHLEKKLSSIEGSLRNRQKRMATGFDGQFMPLASYIEFREDFDATRKEYFALKDEIVDMWESLVLDYKDRLGTLLQDLNAIERENVHNSMINIIPQKEDYRNSFKMFMSVKTMPQVEEESGLHAEINEIIAQDIIGVVFETIAGCIDKSFVLANSAVKGYREGEISIRTVGAIRKIPTTLRTRNVVANNPKIEEVAMLFEEAAASGDRDEMAGIAEIILAKTFVYATKNNLPLSGTPALPREDLVRLDELS